ncbi:hypothetical protein HDU93_007421 [Gonapodya sp. JEL0774]|nr:hypothetical protein HDU93_007421 [Gonapodya sp. JEL0774]
MHSCAAGPQLGFCQGSNQVPAGLPSTKNATVYSLAELITVRKVELSTDVHLDELGVKLRNHFVKMNSLEDYDGIGSLIESAWTAEEVGPSVVRPKEFENMGKLHTLKTTLSTPLSTTLSTSPLLVPIFACYKHITRAGSHECLPRDVLGTGVVSALMGQRFDSPLWLLYPEDDDFVASSESRSSDFVLVSFLPKDSLIEDVVDLRDDSAMPSDWAHIKLHQTPEETEEREYDNSLTDMVFESNTSLSRVPSRSRDPGSPSPAEIAPAAPTTLKLLETASPLTSELKSTINAAYEVYKAKFGKKARDEADEENSPDTKEDFTIMRRNYSGDKLANDGSGLRRNEVIVLETAMDMSESTPPMPITAKNVVTLLHSKGAFITIAL